MISFTIGANGATNGFKFKDVWERPDNISSFELEHYEHTAEDGTITTQRGLVIFLHQQADFYEQVEAKKLVTKDKKLMIEAYPTIDKVKKKIWYLIQGEQIDNVLKQLKEQVK